METVKASSAVPIITNVIPYLEREILDKYADIHMISTEFDHSGKSLTKIHSLALLTFTSFFRENLASKEDDELVIITEFSREDLVTFANFVMEGIIINVISILGSESFVGRSTMISGICLINFLVQYHL